jgi:hypothetical protein
MNTLFYSTAFLLLFSIVVVAPARASEERDFKIERNLRAIECVLRGGATTSANGKKISSVADTDVIIREIRSEVQRMGMDSLRDILRVYVTDEQSAVIAVLVTRYVGQRSDSEGFEAFVGNAVKLSLMDARKSVVSLIQTGTGHQTITTTIGEVLGSK